MPDLEKLSPEELLAAIGTDTDAPLEMSSLKDNILSELNRRFADPELVKDIPGTGLIQLAKEVLKQPDEKQDAAVVEGLDILDALDAVPEEHAIRVLDREIGRRKAELERFEQKRKEYP